MLWNDVKILWLWIIQTASSQFRYCAKFLIRTPSPQDIQKFLSKAISHGAINVWMGLYLVQLSDTTHMFRKRILLFKIFHRDLTKDVFCIFALGCSVQDWSPYMSFILKVFEFQPFSWRAGSNPRRQSKNNEMKYKTDTRLVHELYGTCF